MEISEAQLALRYGCGKAAARAALMRLSQEGLAFALPRRGYQIAPVTIGDIQEIFQLRALLEPQAVRLAVPRADVAALREIDAVSARGYLAGDRASEEAFLRANKAFHSKLILACGNARLVAVLDDIIDQLERLFHLGLARTMRTTELRSQHEALLAAVEARDADRAAAITADHIETMHQIVIEGVMESADVVILRQSAPSGSGRGASLVTGGVKNLPPSGRSAGAGLSGGVRRGVVRPRSGSVKRG